MSSPEALIRLSLVDDHPVLLDSLAHYLRQSPQFQIVATLSDGSQCGEMVQSVQPDVLVMDLSMPGPNAYQRLAQIQAVAVKKPAVLVLASELGNYQCPSSCV
ncbi:response regulator transcription factor [bacterium]|nr:response regulator transcription factor [bacterium]